MSLGVRAGVTVVTHTGKLWWHPYPITPLETRDFHWSLSFAELAWQPSQRINFEWGNTKCCSWLCRVNLSADTWCCLHPQLQPGGAQWRADEGAANQERPMMITPQIHCGKSSACGGWFLHACVCSHGSHKWDAADELPCSICNLPLLLNRLCREEREMKIELKIGTWISDAWSIFFLIHRSHEKQDIICFLGPAFCCQAQHGARLHVPPWRKIIHINSLGEGEIRTQLNCEGEDYSLMWSKKRKKEKNKQLGLYFFICIFWTGCRSAWSRRWPCHVASLWLSITEGRLDLGPYYQNVWCCQRAAPSMQSQSLCPGLAYAESTPFLIPALHCPWPSLQRARWGLRLHHPFHPSGFLPELLIKKPVSSNDFSDVKTFP